MKDWEKINLFQIGNYKSYFVEEYGLIDSIQRMGQIAPMEL